MKNSSMTARDNTILAAPQTDINHRAMLLSLMLPFAMQVLNLVMFGVALPAIRDDFVLQADVVAWLVTGYMLPLMIVMPLYGRLGDELGKRRLFVVGIITFLIGVIIAASAGTFVALLIGRILQGLGAGGIVPLSIAIISQRFPVNERGKALGTWNSVGPLAGIIAPFSAGLLIEYIAWRAIFVPVFLVGIVTIWVVKTYIPTNSRRFQLTLLRSFDLAGFMLLAATVIAFFFYLSSPLLTGRAVLQDWRLAGLTLAFTGAFVWWERRHENPYINLHLFENAIFRRASLTSSTRMFAMGGLGFLLPLYLADVYHLNAVVIGTIITIRAISLLLTMRIGGQLADRWGSRAPIVTGLGGQMLSLFALALLPAATPLWQVTGVALVHGLFAGLSLAALHRASLGQFPDEEAGTAAGVYSLIRFSGMALAPTLTGVVLQQSLDQGLATITAYQLGFGLIGLFLLGGLLLGWGVRE